MKRLVIAFAILLAILLSLFLYEIYKPDNPLTADLASPSQETRDAAAKILRATAKPPSKLKWLYFSWHLKVGETEADIQNLLRSYNLSTDPTNGLGLVGGLIDNRAYRLDGYWLLHVMLTTDYPNEKTIVEWELVPRWHSFFVWPVTNFTGVWVTYYANGQEFTEDHFQNGQRDGECTTYEPEGWKSAVWNYKHGVADGLWTEYFPSGQIQAQCLYSNQIRVGDLVWYYTNGCAQIREHYDTEKRISSRTLYFPSGKIKTQWLFSNTVSDRIEINYNEDGTTNSVIDHSHH